MHGKSSQPLGPSAAEAHSAAAELMWTTGAEAAECFKPKHLAARTRPVSGLQVCS